MSKHNSLTPKVKSERVEFNPVLDKLFKNAGIGVAPQNPQTWEQIDSMYEGIGEYILVMGEEVNNAVKVISLLGISGNVELTTSVRGLTNDIESYTKDLISLKSRHTDKSGPVQDGDDLVLCLSCFEDYFALNERIRANMFPIMLTVTEYLQEAVSKNGKKLEEAAAAAELADVSVVSDIQVKETTHE